MKTHRANGSGTAAAGTDNERRAAEAKGGWPGQDCSFLPPQTLSHRRRGWRALCPAAQGLARRPTCLPVAPSRGMQTAHPSCCLSAALSTRRSCAISGCGVSCNLQPSWRDEDGSVRSRVSVMRVACLLKITAPPFHCFAEPVCMYSTVILSHAQVYGATRIPVFHAFYLTLVHSA